MNATIAVAPNNAASSPREEAEDSECGCDSVDPFMCTGSCKTENQQPLSWTGVTWSSTKHAKHNAASGMHLPPGLLSLSDFPCAVLVYSDNKKLCVAKFNARDNKDESLTSVAIKSLGFLVNQYLVPFSEHAAPRVPRRS